MTNNQQSDNQSDKSHNKDNNKSDTDETKSRVTGRIKDAIKERKNLESKISELTDALQRERADITNIRRRHDEQMHNLRDFAKASVIRDLLPAIDNMERALRHAPKDLEDHEYVKGIQGVVKQFEKILKDIGVERIRTEGEEFDPKYHEAVSMEQGEGSREIISEEMQAGYTLGDEVIRHAMVKVKSGK